MSYGVSKKVLAPTTQIDRVLSLASCPVFPLPLAPRLSPPVLQRRNGGYTLLELLIAMGVASVVLAATIQGMYHFQLRFLAQQTAMVRHQDQRMGMAVMASELRIAGVRGSAGTSPFLKLGAEEVVFLANLAGLSTTLTRRASRDDDVLSVANGSGWRKGKLVRVCDVTHCADARLARNGTRTALLVTSPLAGTFPSGSEVTLSNRVRYYVGKDSQGRRRLMRDVDGGAGTLIEDVDVLELSYLDRRGRPVRDPGQVARVRVRVSGRTNQTVITHEVGIRM